MKIEKTDISRIQELFDKMQSKEDFLHLLNEAKKHVYGDGAVPFEIRQINWYANPQKNSKRYRNFTIKKKSGGERTIHAPVAGLKAIQKTLAFVLQCIFEPHQAATGFVMGKSIVDNANRHKSKMYVYNIDLKDFFPSVDQARVWKCMQLHPFNLNNENRVKLAGIIAGLCCTEMDVERLSDTGEWVTEKKYVLPQGAPTSPVLTNVVSQRLDFLLSAVSKKFGLTYSRYADDITFSSMHNVYQVDSAFLKELNKVIKGQRFAIKDSKTRLQKSGYRQEVTGIVVNEKANVKNKYIKQLRMWLYYWERYGYGRATQYFVQQYAAERGHVKKGQPNMSNVIGGKLEFLKMVRGSEDKLYIKLRERYDNVISKTGYKEPELTLSEEKSDTSVTTRKKKQEIELVVQHQSDPTKHIKLNKDLTLRKGEILPKALLFENTEFIKSPQETAKSLAKLSSDPILQLATHDFDTLTLEQSEILGGSNFNYPRFCQEIEIRFKSLNLPQNTYVKIKNFLLSEENDSWSQEQITIGWRSPQLRTWCENNPGLWPSTSDLLEYAPGFTFEEPMEFKNFSAANFREIIKKFKKEFQFRNDYPIELFLKEIAFDYPVLDFEFDVPSGIEFYTDVEKIKQAIKDILNVSSVKVIEENINNKIKFILREENIVNGSQISLSIKHEGFSIKKSASTYIDRHLKSNEGDFYSKLKNKLDGVVDWKLKARFEDGYYEISLLAKNPSANQIEQTSTPYIQNTLIFYRPT